MEREEAIRRVKAWNLDSDDREVLEVIIPELRESEDERIRQWLYDLVDEGAYLCERPFATESILAYLEKQKEQKPIECIEFANEFENQVSHLLASVLNGEYEYNEGFVKHAAQYLLGFAKHELKHNYCLYGGYPNVGRCRWCSAA